MKAVRIDQGVLRTSLVKNVRTIEIGCNNLVFNDGYGPVTFANLALVNVIFEMMNGVEESEQGQRMGSLF